MVQMVERMDPGAIFSMQEKSKANIGLHNLHHTMFQCMVCLVTDKIWVFKNMQTILCSILWPIHDIRVCHILAWTAYDIHTTIRHHI